LKRALFNQALAFRICFGYNTTAWEARAGIKGSFDHPYPIAVLTINLEFCGGTFYRELIVYVSGQLPVTKRRKIKLCSRPLQFGQTICLCEDYLELEVEEFDSPSAADVAKIVGEDYSPTDYENIASHISSSGTKERRLPLLVPLFEPCDILHRHDSGPGQQRISESSIDYLFHNLFTWSLNDVQYRAAYPPEHLEACLDLFLLGYACHNPPLTIVNTALCISTSICINFGNCSTDL